MLLDQQCRRYYTNTNNGFLHLVDMDRGQQKNTSQIESLGEYLLLPQFFATYRKQSHSNQANLLDYQYAYVYEQSFLLPYGLFLPPIAIVWVGGGLVPA